MRACSRSRIRERLRVGALAVLVLAVPAHALTVVDDAGHAVTLVGPARRVVTIAPSLTELVFAAGGGEALVGTDVLSNHPAAARRVARIGDASRLDVERVISLRPDLVLIWQRGSTRRELEQLEAAGVRLFQLEPRRLDDVPRALERLGTLLGHDEAARRRAGALRDALARLRASHAGAAPVSVFYQVWQQPLMTVNGGHLINDIVALCGGRNVFADLAPLVPILSTEAVVAADPEVMLTASETGGPAAWQREPASPSFATWRRHATMVAVRRGWLYTLNGDAISRQGPRIVDGAAAVCAVLDEVRRERGSR